MIACRQAAILREFLQIVQRVPRYRIMDRVMTPHPNALLVWKQNMIRRATHHLNER
jgi:hypothetical protein